jgi:hypothetical protein
MRSVSPHPAPAIAWIQPFQLHTRLLTNLCVQCARLDIECLVAMLRVHIQGARSGSVGHFSMLKEVMVKEHYDVKDEVARPPALGVSSRCGQNGGACAAVDWVLLLGGPGLRGKSNVLNQYVPLQHHTCLAPSMISSQQSSLRLFSVPHKHLKSN